MVDFATRYTSAQAVAVERRQLRDAGAAVAALVNGPLSRLPETVSDAADQAYLDNLKALKSKLARQLTLNELPPNVSDDVL